MYDAISLLAAESTSEWNFYEIYLILCFFLGIYFCSFFLVALCFHLTVKFWLTNLAGREKNPDGRKILRDLLVRISFAKCKVCLEKWCTCTRSPTSRELPNAPKSLPRFHSISWDSPRLSEIFQVLGSTAGRAPYVVFYGYFTVKTSWRGYC